LIPAQYRGSGLASHGAVDSPAEFGRLLEAWESDEFILDPTRMTLYTADTGYNGNEFKTDVLMDTYGVQINKTSINSVLFIATIGVTWSSVVFLLDVLKRIAEDLERRLEDASAAELAVLSRKVRKLTGGLPHLPDFSRFHAAFRPSPDAREGDLRAAYYLCYGQDNREYVSLEEALSLMEGARELVSTSFVVPYPPGFPVLVPGQEVTPEIVEFMRLLDVKEIHGYRAELGLSVFTPEALGEEEKRRQARCDSL
jgi:arginine decarboxylase